MFKNIYFFLFLSIGMVSMQGCIKKKEPVTVTQQKKATKKAGAIGKARPNKGKAAKGKQRTKQSQLKNNAAGKPLGYWPGLRKHLGIDAVKLQKLKANEKKRVAELAKPGANKNALNTKYDGIAKTLLGPALFAKMQSFTMK